MGKLQQLSIQLEQPDVALYAGQRLLGCVNVTLNEPMKCRNLRLTLTGRAKTNWDEGSGDNSRTYVGRESYVDEVIVLFGSPDGKATTKIPEGHHQFPFEFVLPPNCPSSMEGLHGWIRYYLTAVIKKPWKFDKKIEKYFRVNGQHDMNMFPMAMQPIENLKSKSLGVFGSGELKCCATMPYRGLVAGQRLNLVVHILTTSNKGVTAVNVYLEQQTRFIADGHDRSVYQKILLEANKCFIPGNTPTTLDFTNVQIHPVDPSTINCSIINIIYFIHVEVVPGGMHTDLDLKFPIIIGMIPLRLAVQQGMTLESRLVDPAFPVLYPPEPYIYHGGYVP